MAVACVYKIVPEGRLYSCLPEGRPDTAGSGDHVTSSLHLPSQTRGNCLKPVANEPHRLSVWQRSRMLTYPATHGHKIGWKVSSEPRTSESSSLSAVQELAVQGALFHSDSILTNVSEGETKTDASDAKRWAAVKEKLGTVISNAEKHSRGVHRIGHTLGVDLGDSRTGLAISLRGYAPRPLVVLHIKGDKLIEDLLKIAAKERADEFVVGLPTSLDGKENVQSHKTRSFVGRLATQAAQRGWRVYLMDEYLSSKDGLEYMLELGAKKQSRRRLIDAYAATVLLQSYFSEEGARVKLVVPKGLNTQERLCLGSNPTNNLDEDDIEEQL